MVLGALSLGVKRPENEADHSPPSIDEVEEYVELHLHSPYRPSWRGALLNTGTLLSPRACKFKNCYYLIFLFISAL
jgi:hypothetical protein